MGTEAPLRSAIHAMVLYAFFWSSPPLAYGQTMSLNGMVVSPHPMSAQAGLLILQQGGNAFDAAVATAATAAVVDRIANGSLGGVGGYAMIYHAETKRVRALDYVGAAPRAARLELFLDGARLWDTGHPSRDSFRGPVVPDARRLCGRPDGTIPLWRQHLVREGRSAGAGGWDSETN